MINECKAGLTDIVVVKNISRLGRDTIEVLDAINTLRGAGVRIIFKQEQLSSSNHFKKTFDTVQKEKLKRNNMITDENGRHSSGTKYSSKK